ncbi:phosphotransferase system HPr-like phosphotransfer protein [Caldalkalibacillus uzonensis]|uniref:Phosphotransferase system HPr-like phosphotransfer protein n=1 Tax=Caldalkalibacillus uzonensis TaxID=353224 RepID=A0ABU0CQY3_9BACI|nr:HPr family phosphocarrier protein [Caldalkalibacillus uzonensis]MDQ0338830.1 phosphotransferase system HPr-like phosphotransfer protein [Caldalkalibacillus uzonensis]
MEVVTEISPVKKLNYQQLIQLSSIANRFASYIVIKKETFEVNAKSILALSVLPTIEGKYEIIAFGKDAKEAVDTLGYFLSNTTNQSAM